MGCDIHLHTEVKIGGKWEHYGAPDVRRNYALFEKMANVRTSGEIEPIAEPRGIPSDASVVTKLACDDYGVDGHSHSYLNAAEIAALEDWYKQECKGNKWPLCEPSSQWGFLFGNSWGGFMKYPDERPDGVEDIRFVFWFDN